MTFAGWSISTCRRSTARSFLAKARASKGLALFLPLAPMRRLRVNALHCSRIEPAAEDAAVARKGECVHLAGRVNDGQFQVTVERRGRDRLPIHLITMYREIDLY